MCSFYIKTNDCLVKQCLHSMSPYQRAQMTLWHVKYDNSIQFFVTQQCRKHLFKFKQISFFVCVHAKQNMGHNYEIKTTNVLNIFLSKSHYVCCRYNKVFHKVHMCKWWNHIRRRRRPIGGSVDGNVSPLMPTTGTKRVVRLGIRNETIFALPHSEIQHFPQRTQRPFSGSSNLQMYTIIK